MATASIEPFPFRSHRTMAEVIRDEERRYVSGQPWILAAIEPSEAQARIAMKNCSDALLAALRRAA